MRHMFHSCALGLCKAADGCFVALMQRSPRTHPYLRSAHCGPH